MRTRTQPPTLGCAFLAGVEDFRTRLTPEGKLVKKLDYSTLEYLAKTGAAGLWWQPRVAQTESNPPKRGRLRQAGTEDEVPGEDETEGGSVAILRDPSGTALPRIIGMRRLSSGATLLKKSLPGSRPQTPRRSRPVAKLMRQTLDIKSSLRYK